MSTESSTRISETKIPLPPVDRSDQNPKRWHLVAIAAAGAVALFFGISGSVGLSYSFGSLQLPTSWFTGAVNFVGIWGLWPIAIAGCVGTVAAIGGGIYKWYSSQPKTEENHHEVDPTKNDPSPQSNKALTIGNFKDFFTINSYEVVESLGHTKDVQVGLGQYARVDFEKDGKPFAFFIVNDNNILYSTPVLDFVSTVKPLEIQNAIHARYTAAPEPANKTPHDGFMGSFTEANFDSIFANHQKLKSKIERTLKQKNTYMVVKIPKSLIDDSIFVIFDGQLKAYQNKMGNSFDGDFRQNLKENGFPTEINLPPPSSKKK